MKKCCYRTGIWAVVSIMFLVLSTAHAAAASTSASTVSPQPSQHFQPTSSASSAAGKPLNVGRGGGAGAGAGPGGAAVIPPPGGIQQPPGAGGAPQPFNWFLMQIKPAQLNAARQALQQTILLALNKKQYPPQIRDILLKLMMQLLMESKSDQDFNKAVNNIIKKLPRDQQQQLLTALQGFQPNLLASKISGGSVIPNPLDLKDKDLQDKFAKNPDFIQKVLAAIRAALLAAALPSPPIP